MASAPTPCEEFVYMAKLVEQVKHYEEMVEFMEKKEDHLVVIRNYRSKIKVELSNIYDKILKLLDTHLVPSLTSGDSKVFYLKMKGAYHRYFTEFKIDANRKEAVESPLSTYKAAQICFFFFSFDFLDFYFVM
ncbi:hypothetical protein JHK84_048240 [Glycine max]|nr:hypothetical protein JHK86_048208 [Glycine max]KAG4944192.1 hypothetical protein JHK85_048838 [Glycine max]KAG5103271.1 hypothetical protein JHK84_048240 [Glycine max]KAH1203502.1 14-3-3-like protein [Glycine max]